MIRSGFFNSVGGDRLYDATRFAEYFASFIGNGVFNEPSTNLQVQVDSGMNVKIKAGKAWINGYILVSDSDYSEAIPAEAILNRIDRIVVRLHFANREMSIVRKQGTAASTPTAPVVTRDANMFELSLATINVSVGSSAITPAMIIDTRADIEVCGFVSSTITTLPYLTPFRIIASDSEGKLVALPITDTEFGYLAGVIAPLQDQINAKQVVIIGAASSIVTNNLGANKVLISNSNGKVVISTVTDEQLSYLEGVNAHIQTQLNGKQAAITGAASSIAGSNLSTNKVLVSDNAGKVAISLITISELEYLTGVSANIQTQINGKLGSSAQAADSLKVGGKKITIGTVAPTSPAIGDVWFDTN